MVSLIFIVLSFFWWDKYRLNKAEKLANEYYSAIKSGDYDKAFEYLLLYKGATDQPEKISKEVAKENYNKNIAILKSIDYKLLDYKVTANRDDYVIGAHATIKVQCDGKIIEASETIQFSPSLEKLWIDYSDDPFSQYSHRYTDFYDVNYVGKLATKLMIEKAEIFKGFGQVYASDGGAYYIEAEAISEFLQAIKKAEKAQEKVDLNKPNYMVRMEFMKNNPMNFKFWVNKEKILFVFAEDPNTVYQFSKGTFPEKDNVFDFVEWKYIGTVKKI